MGGAGHRGAEPAQEQLRHEQQRGDPPADQFAVAARAFVAAGTALVVAAVVALAAVVSQAA